MPMEWYPLYCSLPRVCCTFSEMTWVERSRKGREWGERKTECCNNRIAPPNDARVHVGHNGKDPPAPSPANPFSNVLAFTSLQRLIFFVLFLFLFSPFFLQELDKLTPNTPEVISRQATINIGTIGHVAHGKSTVVRSMTGKSTIKVSKNLVDGVFIPLKKETALFAVANQNGSRRDWRAQHRDGMSTQPPLRASCCPQLLHALIFFRC